MHYIDKLKLGYRSEYGRKSSASPAAAAAGADDLKASDMLTMPPLIPVSDIEGGASTPPLAQLSAQQLANVTRYLNAASANMQINPDAALNMQMGSTGDKSPNLVPPLIPFMNVASLMNANVTGTPDAMLHQAASPIEKGTLPSLSNSDSHLPTDCSRSDVAYTAGVLTAHALALAKATCTNVANFGMQNKNDPAAKGADKENDSAISNQKTAQSNVSKFYSPQMVQAGKASKIPLRSPGFPLRNPFVKEAQADDEGNASLVTSSQVAAPNANDSSTGSSTSMPVGTPHAAPGYLMMPLPLMMPVAANAPAEGQNEGHSQPSTSNAVPAPQLMSNWTPQYTLAMAQALASAAANNSGVLSNNDTSQINNKIISLLSLLQMNQMAQGQVLPSEWLNSMGLDNSVKDLLNPSDGLEPGEIAKNPVARLGTALPAIASQLPTSLNSASLSLPPPALLQSLMSGVLAQQLPGVLGPGTFAEAGAKMAAQITPDTAQTPAFIEPKMAPTGATSNKSRGSRLNRNTKCQPLTVDVPLKGTKKRKQSCPSRAPTRVDDDDDETTEPQPYDDAELIGPEVEPDNSRHGGLITFCS